MAYNLNVQALVLMKIAPIYEAYSGEARLTHVLHICVGSFQLQLSTVLFKKHLDSNSAQSLGMWPKFKLHFRFKYTYFQVWESI